MVVASLQCVSDGVPPSSVDPSAIKSTLAVDSLPPSRRSSVRIQAIKRLQKEELVRKRAQLLDDPEEEVPAKKPPNKKSLVHARPLVKEGSDVAGVEAKDEQRIMQEEQMKKLGKEPGICDLAIQISPQLTDRGQASGKSADAIVKDTLRTFNKYYLHFVQEEKSRCGRKKEDEKQSLDSMSKYTYRSSKSKKTAQQDGVSKPDTKSTSKRPDLKAISKMLNTGAVMYPKKRIGDLPGIDVGHQFYSRAEMVAIGFHDHWLNGIDFMGARYQKEYKNYTLPLAVAIVLSGMYEDDHDNADEVTYTGQGGHNLIGDKRHIKDQVLERGNLALKV
ncbi:Histone-lysine N-methyltransferase, H3 lysine-9 specific SUVH4 [Linum perenne]